MKIEIYRKVSLVLLSLLWAVSIQADDIAFPVGQPWYDLEYQLKFNSVLDAGDLKFLPSTGPFRISEMSLTGSPIMKLLAPVDESHLRIITLANNRIQGVTRTHPNYYYTFTGGVRYTLSDNFGLLGYFSLDREKAHDPDYVGHRWRGLAGSVETAALYYSKPSVTVTLGRQRVFWGPQPVNLALSSTAEPLDLFSLRYQKGRLTFNFLFARLDASRPDSVDYQRFPEASFTENRYLAAHRLDLRLHKRFRIGFFEMTLFGGEGRPPELYYLNPLQFFHGLQLNEQIDDNTAIGLDFIWLPGWRWGLYGQLLIDDLQVDDELDSDQEPNEIGLMAGLSRAGEIGSWTPDIKLEYVKISNRTYHQRQPKNRYLYRGQLLGHPLGPDADSLSFKLTFRPSLAQFVEFEAGLSRHGEGSIYGPWDEPWLQANGDYSEPFPTGVVEKAAFVAVRAGGYLPFGDYLADHLYFSAGAGHGNYDNWQNIEGESATQNWFRLSLTWLAGAEVDVSD